jgi:hypothetical protein
LSAFASYVTRAQLLAGYITNDLPAGTTLVKVKSWDYVQTLLKLLYPITIIIFYLQIIIPLDYIAKQTYSYFYGFIEGVYRK